MSNKATKKLLFILFFIAILATGLFFRIWNLGFGLPHSFYADEPEIAELAIKYTYEFKDIVSNNNYYKLIPISYVYGTFPAYLLTVKVMFFSKFLNVLRIPFDKTTLYIFMRFLMVAISLMLTVASAVFYKKLFKDNVGFFITLGILALNWKFIVHSHYVNADIILSLLLNLSFLFFYLSAQKNFDNLNTVLSGIFFGLAAGTKFTALISLPLFLFILLVKKDFKATLGFLGTALIAFLITNPFSIIFFKNFSFRVFEMFFKEGGMVFDSVDSNLFKYIYATVFMLGIPLFIFSITGMVKAFKENVDKKFHLFLISNIFIYLLFYSLQSRRVDRWLLPILPIFMIYASHGLLFLVKKFGENISTKRLLYAILFLLTATYAFYPLLLLTQFQKDTPKSAAYKWVKSNIPAKKTLLPYVLVYTEEGLDPINKFAGADVKKVNVYVSENAQLYYPEDPLLYEYVIISSRPMSNYKRQEVIKAYPYLAQRWNNFEETLFNQENFELIKDFTLTKPNLIPLSDVYIYRNLKYTDKILSWKL